MEYSNEEDQIFDALAHQSAKRILRTPKDGQRPTKNSLENPEANWRAKFVQELREQEKCKLMHCAEPIRESISSINVLWPALETCRSFKFFMSPSLGFWYELNIVLMSLLRTRCVTNVPMNLRLFNIIALSTFICTLYLSFKASAIKAKKKSRNSNDFSILEKNFVLTAISIASAGLSDLSLALRGSEILIGIRNGLGSSEFRMAVN
uniref:Uncharacterized protein n=1 Tax=Glossina palpalis gambiensis TaxID=67801 RepID=A0A1B0BX06_9MUSC